MRWRLLRRLWVGLATSTAVAFLPDHLEDFLADGLGDRERPVDGTAWRGRRCFAAVAGMSRAGSSSTVRTHPCPTQSKLSAEACRPGRRQRRHVAVTSFSSADEISNNFNTVFVTDFPYVRCLYVTPAVLQTHKNGAPRNQITTRHCRQPGSCVVVRASSRLLIDCC